MYVISYYTQFERSNLRIWKYVDGFLQLFGVFVYELHKFIQNLTHVIQNVLTFCIKELSG